MKKTVRMFQSRNRGSFHFKAYVSHIAAGCGFTEVSIS